MQLANNTTIQKISIPQILRNIENAGVHTKSLFDEVRNLSERIPAHIAFEQKYGNQENINRWRLLQGICEDLLEKEVKSKFFKWQKVGKILRKSFSQIRPITIKPKLVSAIRDTLKSGTPIRNPLWTVDIETMTVYDSTLVNGGNRYVAVKEEMKAKTLPQDHHVGTVHLPRKETDELKPILSSIQAVLNDHLPSEPNDKNCVQKHLKEKVKELGWEGQVIDDKMKEKLTAYALVTFSNTMSPKGIKGNVTRLQNKLREQNGHVLAAPPEDFIARAVGYINYLGSQKAEGECKDIELGSQKAEGECKDIEFSKPKSYNKEVVDIPCWGLNNVSFDFVSTKGSVLDQLLKRQVVGSHNKRFDSSVEVFAAQDHGGDFDTVMKSRVTYFEDKYRLWSIAQDIDPETGERYGGYRDNVVPDAFVISPQLQGDSSTSLFGKKETILPEETELVISDDDFEKKIPDYKVVFRRELIECFKTGKAFKPEWVAKLSQ